MLKLSSNQMRAFERIDQPRFSSYMVEHLKEYFPHHTSLLTDDELLTFIKFGIQRAANHRIYSRYEACLYIDLMGLLGSYFDEDVMLPCWIELLHSPESENKVEKVYSYATIYLSQIFGHGKLFPEVQYYILSESLIGDAGIHSSDSKNLAHILGQLWIEKYGTSTTTNIYKFINQCKKAANHHGLFEPSYVNYFTVLEFILGQRIAENPFYPWIGAAFAKSSGEIESVKFSNICHRVRQNIHFVLFSSL